MQQEQNGFEPIGDEEEFKTKQKFGQNWTAYNFYWDKKQNKSAFNQCPQTGQIIDSTTDELFGWSCFSRLKPNFNIDMHHGYTNMRLTLHMGLLNLDDCHLVVDGQQKKWEEGKVFIFDDMYDHMVVNNTDKERTVLIIDLFHPDLTEKEKQAYRYYINHLH